jgi:hypothetical protein
MNRRLQRIAVLVMMAWSAAAAAQQQYEYLGFKMLNNRDYPFPYYLDARVTNPAEIALSQVEAATTAAFQTWENVACAYPDFQYMGYSTTASIPDVRDTYDAYNVSTIWVTNPSDPYYNMALAGGNSPSGTIPLTYAGYLYQCDIFINAVNFRWTTLASSDARFRDLQTALTHEVGHCMGLGDAYAPTSAVMYPEFPPGGSKRVLDAQDVTQICEYYPENGAVGSPCSDSDPCTNGLACIPFTGNNNNTLYKYCSKSCTGNDPAECPSPFVCQASSAISGATRACLAVPNQAVTQVGKPCGTNDQCGSPVAVCQTPTAIPGGTAWVDGYCQQPCNAGSTANTCPAGSVCVNTDPGTNDRCLKRCRPGSGDCRQGYTCSPLAEGDVCVPNCYLNADCNGGTSATNYLCRTCDNVCIENKQTGRSVGDPCSRNEECGPGQVCLFINNHPEGICSQPCSTAACTCPVGTRCKQVGPDLMCMKDCASGTCSSPAQCNPVGSTYSCTARCRTRNDCPTGFECYPEGCVDPSQNPDAGCTLCGTDAGTPPPPTPPTDGGTGGDGGPGGCGCGQAPASAMILSALLVLLMMAGGRRSWPRR